MQVQNSSFKLEDRPAETTPKQSLENWLIQQLGEQLSLDTDKINVTEPLTRYGLDSIDAVTIVGDLEDWLDLELPSTLFWDHPTIEKSAQYLADNFDLGTALNNLESSSSEENNKEAEVTTENSKKGWGNLWRSWKTSQT